MSTVYMTEVEQVELLKKWWKRNNRVVITSMSVLLLLFSVVRYWQWHQQQRTEDASNAYEHLMLAFSSADTESVQAYAQQLVGAYAGTVYADTARLIQAKLALTSGDYAKAKADLQEVADHSKFIVLADLARLRLARVLIYEKAYTDALHELDRIKNTDYASLQTELRGDIYYAQSNLRRAKRAYQHAKADIEKSGVANLFLEMKQHNLRASVDKQSTHSIS